MATRSRIGIVTDEGVIKSAYCHNDGYPEHNGEVLLTHFSTKEKIETLLEDGYISFISDDGEIERVNSDSTLVDDAVDEFLKTVLSTGGEYAYLFMNNEWVAWQYKSSEWIGTRCKTGGWHKLPEVNKRLPR